HELRTPLSVIIGYSAMLEEEAAMMAEAHREHDLGRIKHSGRHLNLPTFLGFPQPSGGCDRLFNLVS
ncbi:MAG: histidine kinase dimerization/phospho-acceptor domain-containing protein, partial [Chloroflexota bacterium]